MSRAALRAAILLATLLLASLGVWQLQRHTAKHALVAQVEARLGAPPVAAPGPGRWPAIGRDDAYRRVEARGRYLTGRDTGTQAVTDLGPGRWVMTPLVTDAGWTLLVNRGFVPKDAQAGPPPAGKVTVRGLLRLSEPGGGFLRANAPAAGRWYSRDVAAIAGARGLGRVAPYFVDAERAGDGWPRGGLTVVRFSDNHLVYALTWFALAGLLPWLVWRAGRSGRSGARSRSS